MKISVFSLNKKRFRWIRLFGILMTMYVPCTFATDYSKLSEDFTILFFNAIYFIGFLVLVFLVVIATKKIRADKSKTLTQPPKYNWVCPSCESVNKKNTDICVKCSYSV